jgi:hypothetical protein
MKEIVNILFINPSVLSKYFEEKVLVNRIQSPIVVYLDGIGFGKTLEDKPVRDYEVHRALIEGCKNLISCFNVYFCRVVSDEVNLYLFRNIPYRGGEFNVVSVSATILSSSV